MRKRLIDILVAFMFGLSIFLFFGAYTRDWNESTPTDATVANQIDDFNRYDRVDTAERLEDYVAGFNSGDANEGFYHALFIEKASTPSTPAAAKGMLYGMAVGGKCELHWIDEDGDEKQITSGGVLKIAAGDFDANAIDSDDYIDGSIDAEHLAADVVDETKIADDGVDSEHYNDGSIDAVHIANLTPDDYTNDGDGDSRESVTFANGLIMKMGYVAYSSTTQTITFDTAFSNGVVSVSVTNANGSTANINLAVHSVGTSSFVIQAESSITGFYWMAVGY